MDGMRALDVGTWDGFWAFEMERRGARSSPSTRRRARPRLAAAPAAPDLPRPPARRRVPPGQGDPRLEGRARELLDLQRHARELGTFDIVFCGSVLIHLRDQLLALERIAGVCNDTFLSVEEYDRRSGWVPWPSSRYLADRDKAVVFWLPSIKTWKRMLWTAGFDHVEQRGKFRSRRAPAGRCRTSPSRRARAPPRRRGPPPEGPGSTAVPGAPQRRLDVVALGGQRPRRVAGAEPPRPLTRARAGGIDVGQALVEPGCFFFGSKARLGDWTLINHRCYFDTRDWIEIGTRCSIAMEVMFCTSTHAVGEPTKRAGDYTRRRSASATARGSARAPCCCPGDGRGGRHRRRRRRRRRRRGAPHAVRGVPARKVRDLDPPA